MNIYIYIRYNKVYILDIILDKVYIYIIYYIILDKVYEYLYLLNIY